MSTNAPRGHQRPTFASHTNCEIEHSCVRFGVCGEVRSQSQRHTLCERRPLFQNKQLAFAFRLLLFVLWSQYFTVARTRIQFKKSIKPSCYIPDVTGLLSPFVLVCLPNVYLYGVDYAIPCLVPNIFHEVRSQSTFIGSHRLV